MYSTNRPDKNMGNLLLFFLFNTPIPTLHRMQLSFVRYCFCQEVYSNNFKSFWTLLANGQLTGVSRNKNSKTYKISSRQPASSRSVHSQGIQKCFQPIDKDSVDNRSDNDTQQEGVNLTN